MTKANICHILMLSPWFSTSQRCGNLEIRAKQETIRRLEAHTKKGKMDS